MNKIKKMNKKVLKKKSLFNLKKYNNKVFLKINLNLKCK